MRNKNLTDVREKLSTQDRANGSSYFNIDTLYEGITRISNIISYNGRNIGKNTHPSSTRMGDTLHQNRQPQKKSDILKTL